MTIEGAMRLQENVLCSACETAKIIDKIIKCEKAVTLSHSKGSGHDTEHGFILLQLDMVQNFHQFQNSKELKLTAAQCGTLLEWSNNVAVNVKIRQT